MKNTPILPMLFYKRRFYCTEQGLGWIDQSLEIPADVIRIHALNLDRDF